MNFGGHPDRHLTYCLNVHPGETWDEHLAAIHRYALAVRDAAAPGQPFGLGLRLGAAAAKTLSDRQCRADFRDFLAAHGLYVFSVNAFPYGAFHGAPVKHTVYRPDWSRPERGVYTRRVLRILADLLPEGVRGSVSTLPLGYRFPGRRPPDEETMIANLARCAVLCDRLRIRTGHEVHLGLEPEPGCLLETTEQTIAFFARRLFRQGAGVVAGLVGTSRAAAERLLRRHVGVCFDTCHLALQYEDLPRSLEQYAAAGIRISKIQLSAALQARPTARARAALRAFADPVYLHQVMARDRQGAIRPRGDLTEALSTAPWAEDEQWRVHAHVPLPSRLGHGLGTTAALLDRRFFKTALRLGVEHFEVETYTLEVLPPELRRGGPVAALAGDLTWALSALPVRPAVRRPRRYPARASGAG